MPATPNLRTRAARLVAGLRERHRWLDVALRGHARYQRTEGPVAAVHVAYSAFFSIFPLLFAAVGIFGLVLRNNPELRARILEEAAANLPGALNGLVEQSIRSAQTSARTALGAGLLLLLYSGTGMVVALERGLSGRSGWSGPAASSSNAPERSAGCSASGCCSGCRWRPPPSSPGPAARSWRPPG
jgi:Virulence factor BrkB